MEPLGTLSALDSHIPLYTWFVYIVMVPLVSNTFFIFISAVVYVSVYVCSAVGLQVP
jgi:hypothetical protein